MFEWLRERSGDVVADVAFGCVIRDGDGFGMCYLGIVGLSSRGSMVLVSMYGPPQFWTNGMTSACSCRESFYVGFQLVALCRIGWLRRRRLGG